MPSGLQGNGTGRSGMGAYPVAYSFGFLVLVALGVIVVIRYFYGSIRVEGGVR